MGQCGCADGFGDFKFRGRGGWYVLTLYPGCVDCDTPAGTVVQWYDDNSNIIDCIKNVPDVTGVLIERGKTADGLFLPVFNFHDLVKEEAIADMASPAEYATVKDLVSDMQYVIRQATITTINRTLKETELEAQGSTKP